MSHGHSCVDGPVQCTIELEHTRIRVVVAVVARTDWFAWQTHIYMVLVHVFHTQFLFLHIYVFQHDFVHRRSLSMNSVVHWLILRNKKVISFNVADGLLRMRSERNEIRKKKWNQNKNLIKVCVCECRPYLICSISFFWLHCEICTHTIPDQLRQ